MLDPALEELDVLGSRLALVLSGKRQHIVGHVEAVGFARRADTTGREQHVDPAARTKIEDRLAFFEVCERGWIAAAERRRHGSSGSDPVSSSA
jgi:hypothetical protein